MKKFYVTVLHHKGKERFKAHRIVPARNKREAIANCSETDKVISCEPYAGQDLMSPAMACLDTIRYGR